MKQNNVVTLKTYLLTLWFDCDDLRAVGTGRVKFDTDRQQNVSRHWVTLLLVSHEFKAE